MSLNYLLYIPPRSYTCWVFLFTIRFSFTDTGNSQNSRGREGTIFYSTLPLPLAHEHWGIYLQLCMWDDYLVFLIATLVFTRLLLDENFHLIELPSDWLFDDAVFICLLGGLVCYFSLIFSMWNLISRFDKKLYM